MSEPNNTHVMVCKTCGNNFSANYCNHCGQKLKKHRLTVLNVLNEAFTNVFNLEAGFFYTVKRLIVNPKEIIPAYINGSTKRIYSPLKFLILIAAINAILLVGLEIFELQQIEMYKAFDFTENQIAQGKDNAEYLKNYLNVMPLLVIAFYALASKIFVRKPKYNYAEHVVLCSYSIGLSTLIGMTSYIFVWFLPKTVLYLMGITFAWHILSYFYLIKHSFNYSYPKAFIKSFFVTILAMVLFLLFITTITVLIVLIFKFVIKA